MKPVLQIPKRLLKKRRKTVNIPKRPTTTIRVKYVPVRAKEKFQKWCEEHRVCMTAAIRYYIRNHADFKRRILFKNKGFSAADHVSRQGRLITNLKQRLQFRNKQLRIARALLKKHGLY